MCEGISVVPMMPLGAVMAVVVVFEVPAIAGVALAPLGAWPFGARLLLSIVAVIVV